MSVEGTLAGLLASFFLASVGCFLGQVIEVIKYIFLRNGGIYVICSIIFSIFTSLC